MKFCVSFLHQEKPTHTLAWDGWPMQRRKIIIAKNLYFCSEREKRTNSTSGSRTYMSWYPMSLAFLSFSLSLSLSLSHTHTYSISNTERAGGLFLSKKLREEKEPWREWLRNDASLTFVAGGCVVAGGGGKGNDMGGGRDLEDGVVWGGCDPCRVQVKPSKAHAHKKFCSGLGWGGRIKRH